MRWDAGDYRFGRPVRWLVALLGKDVLPLDAFGLAAGRTTFGHEPATPLGGRRDDLFDQRPPALVRIGEHAALAERVQVARRLAHRERGRVEEAVPERRAAGGETERVERQHVLSEQRHEPAHRAAEAVV